MKQRKSTEDYLKVIYILGKTDGDVHGSRVAEKLGVSRPTVSVSLKSLEKEGYITMDKGRTVHLTESGKMVAEEIYERHRMLQRFLQKIGVAKETAAADACKMEHSLSSESYEALKCLSIQSTRRRTNDD